MECFIEIIKIVWFIVNGFFNICEGLVALFCLFVLMCKIYDDEIENYNSEKNCAKILQSGIKGKKSYWGIKFLEQIKDIYDKLKK